jgi:hypothetical protein
MGSCPVMVVPCPGADSTFGWPPGAAGRVGHVAQARAHQDEAGVVTVPVVGHGEAQGSVLCLQADAGLAGVGLRSSRRVSSWAVTSRCREAGRSSLSPAVASTSPAWEATSARRLTASTPMPEAHLRLIERRAFTGLPPQTITGKAKIGNLSESDRKTSRRHGHEPP